MESEVGLGLEVGSYPGWSLWATCQQMVSVGRGGGGERARIIKLGSLTLLECQAMCIYRFTSLNTLIRQIVQFMFYI